MTAHPLHLLTLAPISDEDKRKLEQAFDSVHYAQGPELAWNAGPPIPVPQEILDKTTAVFGWQLPSNVTRFKQIPNLEWMMTPSAGADASLLLIWQLFKRSCLQSKLSDRNTQSTKVQGLKKTRR